MLKLLVTADDFTGALDTGVQFSKEGAKVLVTTNKHVSFEEIKEQFDVIVIDTETRHLSPEKSYNILKSIFAKTKKIDITNIYKKIDSALRGNISSEIRALTDVFDKTIISMVPAYPEINRTVDEGILYIEDKMVSQSVFSKDPYEPVLESNISKILEKSQLKSNIRNPDQDPIEGCINIYNTKIEKELSIISDNLFFRDETSKIVIGCAGFAKNYEKKLFLEEVIEDLNLYSTNSLLVMSGSVNKVTKDQILFAEKKGNYRLSLTDKQLLNSNYWKTDIGKKEVELFLNILKKNSAIVMFDTFSNETIEKISNYKILNNLSEEEIRTKIGQSLGQLTKILLSNGIDRTILFTGGDTLYQVMTILKIDSLIPISEISQGVVHSQIIFEDKIVNVLTKSGGFGSKELLIDLNNIVEQKGVK
ncbi:hypothetical protein HMPREF9318_00808 [Streptococcus urinalis FB127-CNA-2]|uniref:YgbK domain protein n=1 Tax=Streptococcus urinalis 2285-97 TaxID=764291 RepID=G5KHU2_9STRE|nr:four-carbon acid sugar kinase family protein [Streptococcus urinalis]EHJ57771.1 YgbK domain protein [Streptococcus urinalis 2285-97]EKS22610.1 hypothetical protein HMPREF9318_00808 [Streptococcus urinalis FB127-CNA-2]VEF32379.1 Uncharacterized protein conserved in bacteria [Streptococcus urinalis]